MGLKSSIKELLPAYLEGRTDADQTEAVERWLDESEENRALLRDEAEVLQITDTLDSLNRAGRQTPRSSLKRRMLRKQAGRILKWVRRDRFPVVRSGKKLIRIPRTTFEDFLLKTHETEE